jgi:hypothetical protein
LGGEIGHFFSAGAVTTAAPLLAVSTLTNSISGLSAVANGTVTFPTTSIGVNWLVLYYANASTSIVRAAYTLVGGTAKVYQMNSTAADSASENYVGSSTTAYMNIVTFVQTAATCTYQVGITATNGTDAEMYVLALPNGFQ